jgi:hypothetical protein
VRPSDDPIQLQEVAFVFLDNLEFRVMAPAQAEGDALEWLGHWTVRTSSQDEFYGESEIEPDSAMRIYVLKVAKEQLEKLGRNKSTQDSPEPHYHVLLYTAGARQAET